LSENTTSGNPIADDLGAKISPNRILNSGGLLPNAVSQRQVTFEDDFGSSLRNGRMKGSGFPEFGFTG
jgi:hypothetical protein